MATAKSNTKTRKQYIEEQLDEKTVELEELTAEISDLEDQLYEQEEMSKYVECAKQIKLAHDSFIEAGFSDEQAFTLLIELLKGAPIAKLLS